MRLVHTMIRVTDLDRSLRFYTEGLGLRVVKRDDYAEGRFTLAFLACGSGDREALIELTHNWDTKAYDRGNAFGHLAFQVPSIGETRRRLVGKGYDLSWGPDKSPSGSTIIAFVDDPDGYEIELIEDD
jgi:lactoylglutathione lyase